jgi:ribose/xylose/arabinose/galactoside ABC-type transport system permease subunit
MPPSEATAPWRPRLPADFLRTAVPLLAVIVVVSLYTNSRNGAFLTSDNVQNILVQSSALGILAIGQTFLLVGGQLDLSVGSMVSFTGVVGAYQYTRGWNEWLILVTLLVIGSGVGLLWGVVVTYLRVPPFILTLGGLSVFSSLALVISDSRPISVVNAFNSLGFDKWLGLQAPVTLFLLLLLAGGFLLHFTRFGRQVYALGSSEQVAFLAGLPTNRIKVAIFVLNGALAGVAGLVQLARLAAGDPTAGSGLELACIAAVVLGGASLAGGRGTMVGTLIGTVVFGVIDASLVFLNVAASWQDTVSGGVLIFAVTATAVSDLRRERRSGRDASVGSALTRLLLSRSQRPPTTTTATPGVTRAQPPAPGEFNVTKGP